MKSTVLLYNFSDRKRKNKVGAFCAMHGIRLRTVSEDEYGKPLHELAGISREEAGNPPEATEDVPKGFPDEMSEDFADEMMIFCGVPGNLLNPMLAYLRKEKVVVPLKAVLTQTNQFWDSVKLYREISEEHVNMTQAQG